MKNIAEIPMEGLQKDLQEAQLDVLFCQKALDHGIRHYGPGESESVAERINGNKAQIQAIEAEIKRRKDPLTPGEFVEEVKALCDNYLAKRPDSEGFHSYTDALMEDTLTKLGYGAGVQAIRAIERWYTG